VVIGFRVARKAALQCGLNEDLTERLEHIILSHQGEKEWGAAAMAATPEAVFVSMVDNLDAKMGMVQRVLRNTPPNEAFSEFLPGLQTRVLLTPPEK
jgi:3'-5' exoribonuclease